jgi:hypothetical protein
VHAHLRTMSTSLVSCVPSLQMRRTLRHLVLCARQQLYPQLPSHRASFTGLREQQSFSAQYSLVCSLRKVGPVRTSESHNNYSHTGNLLIAYVHKAATLQQYILQSADFVRISSDCFITCVMF